MVTPSQIDGVIESLGLLDVTGTDFLLALLEDPNYTNHPCAIELLAHSNEIFSTFHNHPQSTKSTLTWANNIMKRKYAHSIQELASKESGWHFNASNALAKQLQDFHIEDMAHNMQRMAPELWDLLGVMLSADRKNKEATVDKDGDKEMLALEHDPDEDEFEEWWAPSTDIDMVNFDENGGFSKPLKARRVGCIGR